VGKKYKRVSWNIAYQLAYGPTRTVSSLTGAGGPATANGNYDFLSHALTIDLAYHF